MYITPKREKSSV